jgi:hypothetical protein
MKKLRKTRTKEPATRSERLLRRLDELHARKRREKARLARFKSLAGAVPDLPIVSPHLGPDVPRDAEVAPLQLREIRALLAKHRCSALVRAATTVFGNREDAILWLNTPQRALQGTSPLAVVGTKIGQTRVLNLLGAIEDGGYM